ncbi:Cro/Cl family transcriptional regulator [Gammaproteobacteria bacterium ESL0073]|nr:Cro/Cl family transcriptional regulator [Gammaproteobacteria bacterium ESL0073]
MNKIPLKKYVEDTSQGEAAKKLGTTQGAVSKAIRKNREIYVVEEQGKLKAFEVRPFPSQIA